MEDEGGFSFDFEGGLEAAVAPVAPTQLQQSNAAASSPQTNAGALNQGGNAGGGQKVTAGRKNYRQTVCRHWLRGPLYEGRCLWIFASI